MRVTMARQPVAKILGYSGLALSALLIGQMIGTGRLVPAMVLMFMPLGVVLVLGSLTYPHLIGYAMTVILYANLDVFASLRLNAHLGIVFLGLSLGYLGMIALTQSERTPFGRPVLIYGLFFVVAIATSALLPGANHVEVYYWSRHITYAYSALLVVYFVSNTLERIRIVSKILTWTGVLLALVNALEFYDPSLFPFSEVSGRSAGLLQNANPSAAAIFACFIISYLAPGRFVLLARAVMLFGVYTTFSRSIIILFLPFTVYLELFVRGVSVRYLFRAAATLILAAIVLAYGSKLTELSTNKKVRYAYARIEQTQRGRFDDTSTHYRIRVIGVNLERFFERPIFGHGGGAATKIDSPHNQILLVMAEHGFVGLVLFVAMLVALWRQLRAIPPGVERRIMLSLYIYQVINMSFTHSEYHLRFYPIIFGFLMAAGEVLPRELRGKESEGVGASGGHEGGWAGRDVKGRLPAPEFGSIALRRHFEGR